MRTKKSGINRRAFLRQSVTIGLGAFVAPCLVRTGWAATKDRVIVLQGVGLDSLNPYAYSAAPQYGIWQHLMEPLVEMDFARKQYVGVLAESWEFQGTKW